MKTINFLSIIIVIILNVIVIVCTYWLVYPYKPIEFLNLPHKVATPIIKSGGYLVYDVDFCKYTEIIPIVSKHFVDGIIYTVPPEIATKKNIGCNYTQVQVYVPKALPKGVYYLEIQYRYQMNPLRKIDTTTKTEKFLVE